MVPPPYSFSCKATGLFVASPSPRSPPPVRLRAQTDRTNSFVFRLPVLRRGVALRDGVGLHLHRSIIPRVHVYTSMTTTLVASPTRRMGEPLQADLRQFPLAVAQGLHRLQHEASRLSEPLALSPSADGVQPLPQGPRTARLAPPATTAIIVSIFTSCVESKGLPRERDAGHVGSTFVYEAEASRSPADRPRLPACTRRLATPARAPACPSTAGRRLGTSTGRT